MSDDPIIPRTDEGPFASEVIDLDGVRVERGLPDTPHRQRCEHRQLVYNTEERRVWCKGCKRTVENFEAFTVLAQHFENMVRAAAHKMEIANAALKATIHRRATKAIDKAWSGHVGAIGCPHCRGGLLPEDFADGVRSWTSREIELARRAKGKGDDGA